LSIFQGNISRIANKVLVRDEKNQVIGNSVTKFCPAVIAPFCTKDIYLSNLFKTNEGLFRHNICAAKLNYFLKKEEMSANHSHLQIRDSGE
jgi:hypothetical protein